MNHTITLFLAGCHVLTATLHAETTSHSLGSIINATLEHNPAVVSARLQTEAKKAGEAASGYLPDPTVSVMLETMDSFRSIGNKGVTLTQAFPGFGKQESERLIARLELQNSELRELEVKSELIRQAVSQFYQIKSLREQLEITSENLALLDQSISIASTRAEAGGSVREVMQLEVEKEKLLDNIEQQRSSLRGRLAALSAYTGRNYSMDDEFVDQVRLPQINDDFVSRLSGNNPKLALAQQQSTLLNEQVQASRLANRPDFMVGIGYTREESMMGGADEEMWSVMFGISLPLWRSKYEARTREALANRRAYDEEANTLFLEIKAEASVLLSRFQYLENSIRRYEEKLIPQAFDVLEISMEEYRNGSLYVFDLLNSQRELLHLRQQLAITRNERSATHWAFITLTHAPAELINQFNLSSGETSE